MTYVSTRHCADEKFPQPDRGDVKVWRYLELSKFVSLLDTNTLYFARTDQFDDPFEGSFTRPVFETMSDGGVGWRAKMRAEFRNAVYVNCWHMNDAESEAMWRLYCPGNRGVAIQTTYEKLDQSLPVHVLLGCVTYADYDTDTQTEPGGPQSSAMYKRLSFKHEQEVRAIAFTWLLETNHELHEIGAVYAPGHVWVSVYLATTTAGEHEAMRQFEERRGRLSGAAAAEIQPSAESPVQPNEHLTAH